MSYSYEDQGTAYDPFAVGHERVGRKSAPNPKPVKLIIEEGKTYRNKRGDLVKITHRLPENSFFRNHGYEFVSDAIPSIFKADGTVEMPDGSDGYNLVKEVL